MIRKMNILTFSIATTFLLLLSGCGSDSKNNLSGKYLIVKEEDYETSDKAQLIEYVVYKDTVYTENALKNVALDIYENNKDKDLFENFNAPTVFGVYMFTSEEILNSDKSGWICMLMKGPSDSEPKISFNDFKLKSLHGLNDNHKSKDEIALDDLNKYLNERGLECRYPS